MNFAVLTVFGIVIRLVFLFLIAWLIVTIIKYLNSKIN